MHINDKDVDLPHIFSKSKPLLTDKMDCKAVFNAIVEILTAYRAIPMSRRTETPQEYAVAQLQNASTQKKPTVISLRRSYEEGEVAFVAEVCAGVERHWGACFGLYEGYTSGMKRTDQEPIQFAVVAYLYIFRSTEVPARTIAALVAHASVAFRVAEFTVFATTQAALEQLVEPRWLHYVQNEYITDFLVPSLVSAGPRLRAAVCPGVSVDLSRSLKGAGPTHGGDASSDEDSAVGDAPPEMPTLSAQYDDDDFPEAALSHASSQPKPSKGSPKASKRSHMPTSTSPAERKPHPLQRGSAALPPHEVREMASTVAPPKPVLRTVQATREELNAVEAAKYGVKLSTLKPELREANREREAAIPFYGFVPTHPPSLPTLHPERDDDTRRMVPCPTVEDVRRRLADVSHKVDYKTTAATVRREELLVRRQRQHEEDKLAQQESNLHDDRAYQQWRQKEEDDAERDRLMQIKERKLEAMISDAEARRAKIKQQNINHKEAERLKVAAGITAQRLAKEKSRERRRLKQHAVEQRETIATQIEEAKKKERERRDEVATAVKQETRDISIQIALETELERERKAQMIADIRRTQKEAAEMRKEAMLERQRENREAITGETSLGNLGASAITMLHKLTVAELKALQGRLAQEHAQLVEEKRLRILSAREEEKKVVQAMERDVAQRREQVKAEKEQQRQQKKDREERIREEQRASEEKKLFELQRRLEDKRAAKKATEEKYKAEEKRRAIASHLLEADGSAVERKKIADLERALGNAIVTNQNASLQIRKVNRAISASEAQRRDTNINQTRQKLNSARQFSDMVAQEQRDALHEERRKELLMQKKVLESLKAERAQRRR